MKRKHYAALVVGAGIAGIRSALDLAEAGLKVALIDRRPNIGGILAQLDHQFPTDACGMCKMLPLTNRDSSSQFCMRKGLFHKNIDILLHTELAALEGDPGKFHATLRQRSTFVDPARCISCGECARVCPVHVPSEYNSGLSSRGAIYMPVPHAIPNHYVVDLDRCTRCWSCFEACPTDAIDFKYAERKDFRVVAALPDEAARTNLAAWLADQNFPLALAESGAAAQQALEQERTALLLLDLAVADVDPEKVMRRGLELYPDLHVILVAGPDDQDRAEALVQAGARQWLARPLERTVVRWLDHYYIRAVSDAAHELEVGAVVLACGFDCYDPAQAGQLWGYGSVPGVVTALEFERMCSGTGPTGGRLLRPDGRPARNVAWLQCVGSRDPAHGADYCSGICCMFAIKEARLARRIDPDARATIFAMDVRTYGKDFQRYRDEAEARDGVRFVRTRIHSIEPDPEADGVPITWMDDNGTLRREVFDLAVLATGARPPAGSDRLAEAAGIALDANGFAAAPPLQPARTSRLGVYAAGAFNEPRDIAESIIQAGAAALNAARTFKVHSPPREEEPGPAPEYRDVTREAPRTLVVLCDSCPTLETKVDMSALATRLAGLSTVVRVARIQGACSAPGWQAVQELAAELRPNRILVGACMPYAYVPRLRELGAQIGLDPAFMDVTDIYTPTFPGAMEPGPALETEVYTALAMAAVKLAGAEPSPVLGRLPVTPRALVVGGGLAGMTAAMALADMGHGVCLSEKAARLGGMAAAHHTLLGGGDPRRAMEDLAEQVMRHPNIKVFTQSRIMLSMGRAGRFMTALATAEGPAITVEHGATIIATGGHEVVPDSYGYRVHKTVLRQSELEARLADGSLDTGALTGVAMIQCVESREEPRNYCSRICCAAALKNALTLKERNRDLPVYVFYRDIMSYGFTERFYTEARAKGVLFIRYAPTDKPRVTFGQDHKPTIAALDPVLGRELRVTVDLLALSVGLEPGDNEELAEVFSLQTGPDGFFREAESKWRPVEFLRQGIFVCGVAHSPRNMNETIASAEAAAQKAARILAHKDVVGGRVTAQVRHSLCSLCGRCVSACAYGARRIDLERGRVEIDELLCQGCGSCAAVCPNSASVLAGFKDGQVLSVIDAALAETPQPTEATP